MSEHSKGTISMGRAAGPRVSKSCKSNWTSCLTYLESTFSFLGYLGVDINFFVNKMFNSHFRPTRDRMRNFLCDELFDCAFGDDKDDLNEALLQAIRVENHASYREFSGNNLELF